MNYAININQYAGEKYFPELDIIDLAVYDYISKFYPMSEKYTDALGIWFWISHSKVIQDMPKLKIKSKSGILKRINNLVDSGIIDRHPNSKVLGRSYYKIGDNFDLLTKVDPYGRKYAGTTDESTQVPTDESTQDHYTKEDHNTSIIIDEFENSSLQNTDTLSQPKQQEEKKTKSSAKNKKEPTLTHMMRETFESFYLEEKKEPYYYTAKDASNLKNIKNKLLASIKHKHGGIEPEEKEINYAWLFVLGKIRDSDPWIYDNLSIPNINSKYNEIISKIKNGKKARNTKGATYDDIAHILAEEFKKTR